VNGDNPDVITFGVTGVGAFDVGDTVPGFAGLPAPAFTIPKADRAVIAATSATNGPHFLDERRRSCARMNNPSARARSSIALERARKILFRQ
jgi:hypothetical protein